MIPFPGNTHLVLLLYIHIPSSLVSTYSCRSTRSSSNHHLNTRKSSIYSILSSSLCPTTRHTAMTEYDYSPEAYEKYVRTQERISNWVSQTKAHERQYANPFVPSEAGGDRSSTPPPKPHRSRSSGSTTTVTVRPKAINPPPPQRSKTLDSRHERSGASPTTSGSSRPSRSRSFTNTSPDSRSSKPRSRSHTHSHSQSYSQPQPLPQRSYTHPPMPMQPPPRSNSTPPVQYKTYDMPGRRGGPVQIPPPRNGETYVIIPPSGRRVELVSPKGSVPYPTSPPRGGQHHERHHSHTYSVKEPLLKRLLGSITWNGGGSQASRDRGSGHGRLEKRARRMSTY